MVEMTIIVVLALLVVWLAYKYVRTSRELVAVACHAEKMTDEYNTSMEEMGEVLTGVVRDFVPADIRPSVADCVIERMCSWYVMSEGDRRAFLDEPRRKVCNRCGKVKPISMFNLRDKERGVYRCECKDCGRKGKRVK